MKLMIFLVALLFAGCGDSAPNPDIPTDGSASSDGAVDCSDNPAICHADATCQSTATGSACVCNDGFEGDGLSCSAVAQMCGNGSVDEGEECDIAIRADRAGGCPLRCGDSNECTTDALMDDGTCLARCVNSEIVVAAEDGCCPAGFDFTGDVDCIPASGAQFTAHSETDGLQRNAAAAMAADGRFVIVWDSLPSGGLGPAGIHAQRFLATGDASGAPLRVNTDTDHVQAFPAVAMASDGRFVVVWVSEEQDGSGDGIFGQLYDASGAAVGTEFAVNSTTVGPQKEPAVAMADDGRFVVTWDGSSGSNVFGQRFDSSAAPIDGEFVVNTFSAAVEQTSTVGMAADGRFVVSWLGRSITNYGIFAQRFGADGSMQGTEFQVNGFRPSGQDQPAVAVAPDGRFIVTWHSIDQGGDDRGGIFGRQFDASGGALGSEFHVNTQTANHQRNPSVATDTTGAFVVAWQSNAASSLRIFGQIYGPSGARIGGEFAISDSSGTERPTVAMSMDNGFVVAWDTGDDVEAKLFAPLP